MTPFVDIAFLILSFFIMATKMKAPETVPTTPPNSVSTELLPKNDGVLITMDKENRVFFTVLSEGDKSVFNTIINDVSKERNLNLTEPQKANFPKVVQLGVPFNQLGSFLGMSAAEQAAVKTPGIPVTDSLNNELVWWISASKKAFAGKKLRFLIKGDSDANYPTFESIVDALKRNDEYKYSLVTSLEEAPPGTDMYINKGK
jgi:biopolymer transport protein ExbD